MGNNIKEELLERRLRWLVAELSNDTEEFLAAHPELKFYSVGLDCNSEYGTMLLCFNTQEEFEKTLFEYQNGDFADSYQTAEDILDLKFNTGDWEYQDVASYQVFSSDELMAMFGDDIDSLIECMMDFNYKVLRAFVATEVFKIIPKTSDFQPICLDHEDDVLEALERTKEVLLTERSCQGKITKYCLGREQGCLFYVCLLLSYNRVYVELLLANIACY